MRRRRRRANPQGRSIPILSMQIILVAFPSLPDEKELL